LIRHLVANGASFTAGNSWAQHTAQNLNPTSFTNLAQKAAGNFYICNSTIDHLLSTDLDPRETMVLVMWAGTGNRDVRISGEWWHLIQDHNYQFGAPMPGPDDSYCLFSGGLSNSWTTNSLTKSIFEWHYKTNDPQSLCKDSLMQFLYLENFLKCQGYMYRFLSPGNCWKSDQSTYYSGNYSIGHFCKDAPVLQKFDFSSWIFANPERDGIYEFCQNIDELDDVDHPTVQGHCQFSQQVILPNLADTVV
jgi:hypothetical protein